MNTLPLGIVPELQAGGRATKYVMGHDPGFMLIAIYQNELKTHVHTKTCTQILLWQLCS